MVIISHRGNLSGPNKETENSPDQVLLAISKGFDVEIDLWSVDEELFLGHDEPIYKIEESFLENIGFRAWIHCKNLDAIIALQQINLPFNYFWHQTDDFTLTSQGYIWTYPGKRTTENSVIVDLSENPEPSSTLLGICTDYPERMLQ
jgi:hypothetical protein